MLFSRAGVRLGSPGKHIAPFVAERSVLYFASQRYGRRTDDPSLGWGHNSRWRTKFYRFYEDEDAYYFNVDGTIDIGSPETLARSRESRGAIAHPNDDLPIEARRELLVHRHFVACTLPDKDRWPYDDALRVRKGEPMWP